MSVITVFAAGSIGTTWMLLVMSAIHRMGWANADMVRAIGSLLMRSRRGAYLPGLIAHYTVGIGLAWIYTALIVLAPVNTAGSALILATMIGLAHGVLMGLTLTIAVAEHHPFAEFRNAGAEVVVVHVIGHVAYGTGVGVVLAFFGGIWRDIPMEWLAKPQSVVLLVALALLLLGVPVFIATYDIFWSNRSVPSPQVRASGQRVDSGQRPAA